MIPFVFICLIGFLFFLIRGFTRINYRSAATAISPDKIADTILGAPEKAINLAVKVGSEVKRSHAEYKRKQEEEIDRRAKEMAKEFQPILDVATPYAKALMGEFTDKRVSRPIEINKAEHELKLSGIKVQTARNEHEISFFDIKKMFMERTANMDIEGIPFEHKIFIISTFFGNDLKAFTDFEQKIRDGKAKEAQQEAQIRVQLAEAHNKEADAKIKDADAKVAQATAEDAINLMKR